MNLKIVRIMKRILILVSLAILVGCNCLSQIPPVTGYVNADCEVALPDFTLLVTVSDNCDATTLSQIPLPGTIVGQGVTNVVVAAMDVSGNVASVTATFVGLDTIAPIITIDETAFLYPTEDVMEMYRTFACWTQFNKDTFLTEFTEFDPVTEEYVPTHLENNIYNNTLYIPDNTDAYECYVAEVN
jgi:hypothetical protein